ncbi:HK97 gp10 family phage protein [Paenibacillaceae bacterium]|nr:HK97 gp10 family phage protein [Paenibacillaceae bacterium]
MGKWAKFDFSEFKRMKKNLENADQHIEQFIRDFVHEMAMRAFRKIRKRTPSSNGQLRRAWTVGEVIKTGDSYTVEIFNNLEYASYIENGFRAHWIPGIWEGNTFRYIAGYKPPKGEPGGMYVGPKDGWVEGKFMLAISMKEIERALPGYLQRRQNQLLEDILSGKPPRGKEEKGNGDQ